MHTSVVLLFLIVAGCQFQCFSQRSSSSRYTLSLYTLPLAYTPTTPLPPPSPSPLPPPPPPSTQTRKQARQHPSSSSCCCLPLPPRIEPTHQRHSVDDDDGDGGGGGVVHHRIALTMTGISSDNHLNSAANLVLRASILVTLAVVFASSSSATAVVVATDPVVATSRERETISGAAGGSVVSTWNSGDGQVGSGSKSLTQQQHRTIGYQWKGEDGEMFSATSTSSTFSTAQQHRASKRDREHRASVARERSRERNRDRDKGYSNSSSMSSSTSSTASTTAFSTTTTTTSSSSSTAAETVHTKAEYDDDDEESEEMEEKDEMESAKDKYSSKSRMMTKQQQKEVSSRRNSYPRSNCSRCQMMAETIQLTKEAIKQQILRKLGLSQAPNITGRPVPQIPPLNHLLDHYGMQADAPGSHFKPGPVFEDAVDDYHAKMQKVITFAQPPPPEWNISATSEVQYFKFSEAVTTNKVHHADLWLYLSPSKTPEDGAESAGPNGLLLHVYKVIRSDHSPPVHSHVYTKKVEEKSHRGRWFTLDAKKLVSEWFRNPLHNFGIVVQAFDKDGHQLIVTNTNATDANSTLYPFLEVHMTDESKRRTRRMIGLNCEENAKEVRCCRYPLTVDFEEFGWDWIIAPKKYEANYCSGECPFVYLQKYPHTHLVQQANPSGSAGPCCAPRKMSSISMLYFDQEFNIIYGLLPGMVVDRCGCS